MIMLIKEKDRQSESTCDAASEKQENVPAEGAVTGNTIHLKLSQSSFIENINGNIVAYEAQCKLLHSEYDGTTGVLKSGKNQVKIMW